MATLERPPTNTMMKVSVAAGATFTSLRIRAAIRPASSATPTPIMATNTTATTVKPAKFPTNDEKRNRIPSLAEEALGLGGLRDDLDVVVEVLLTLRQHDLGSDRPAEVLLLGHQIGGCSATS